jgi:hypothetical protein
MFAARHDAEGLLRVRWNVELLVLIDVMCVNNVVVEQVKGDWILLDNMAMSSTVLDDHEFVLDAVAAHRRLVRL